MYQRLIVAFVTPSSHQRPAQFDWSNGTDDGCERCDDDIGDDAAAVRAEMVAMRTAEGVGDAWPDMMWNRWC